MRITPVTWVRWTASRRAVAAVTSRADVANDLPRQAQRRVGRRSHLTVGILLGVALLGCDEEVVYQDRPPFNPPPDASSGFLGYYDETVKQTTCGNCHADYHGGWSATAHAGAYNTLNSNSGKQDSCFSCHTVTGKGNSASGTVAGHDKVKDAAYFDVQCESCHGQGLEHVEGVGQGNLVRPLAKLSALTTGTCSDCHSGAHHPFADEWKASRHAVINTSRASNPSCVGCHEGRGALAKWGEDANFVEKANATDYQPPAACAVCHDPHGSANPGQLRFPVTAPDPDVNLCMRCHNRRAEPELGSSSPHAPQGAVLLGYAGWRPPGFAYDTNAIYGSHATTKNPRLCAGCHVNKFTVTDPTSGNFVFQATGHLFRPIPCLDAQGKPTADKTCAYTTTARTWQSCTASGCHANASVANTLFNNVRARMKGYTDQLWTDLNRDGSLQAAPTDSGLLARARQARPSDWNTSDTQITPGEGGEFNARLCGEYGQSNADNSKGVHNPFLCEALLQSTIAYIRTYYFPAATVGQRALMEGSIDGAKYRSMHIARTSSGQ